MRADQSAIAVIDLAKSYRTVKAVDGISFSVARGSIAGLLLRASRVSGSLMQTGE